MGGDLPSIPLPSSYRPFGDIRAHTRFFLAFRGLFNMELSFFHTATAILAMALSFASAAPVGPIGLIGPVGPCPEVSFRSKAPM